METITHSLTASTVATSKPATPNAAAINSSRCAAAQPVGDVKHGQQPRAPERNRLGGRVHEALVREDHASSEHRYADDQCAPAQTRGDCRHLARHGGDREYADRPDSSTDPRLVGTSEHSPEAIPSAEEREVRDARQANHAGEREPATHIEVVERRPEPRTRADAREEVRDHDQQAAPVDPLALGSIDR